MDGSKGNVGLVDVERKIGALGSIVHPPRLRRASPSPRQKSLFSRAYLHPKVKILSIMQGTVVISTQTSPDLLSLVTCFWTTPGDVTG